MFRLLTEQPLRRKKIKIQEYEFSKSTRKDLSLVDFINDVSRIINLGRYQMRIITSVPTWTGEGGEHFLYISGSVRRLYFWDSVNETWQFLEWNDSGLGQATIVGTVSLTGQTGNIGATVIYTPAAAGLYRLSTYALCSKAGTGGTLDVTIGFTDDTQAQTSTVVSALDLTVLGSVAQLSIFIRSTAAVITYATVITAGGGAPEYDLYISAERLV